MSWKRRIKVYNHKFSNQIIQLILFLIMFMNHKSQNLNYLNHLQILILYLYHKIAIYYFL